MRLGIHALTKSHNGFFGNESVERETIIGVWKQMGITDVKLLASGDSQVRAAAHLGAMGFDVLVRFYALPGTLPVPPTDLMRQYAAVGVKVVESVNEPELEQGRPPVPEMIDALVQQHIRFADQCAHAGLKPLTPAIQGDRVYSWFEPFVKRIIEVGRKDALLGSYINCHPRPSNNLPETPPPGFVPRSYELFDDVTIANCGESLPIYATEWGYEPGDHDNNELPAIDATLHAAYNVRLAQMTWRPSLYACYYWTWLNDWFQSGYWRGDVASSLLVVRAMLEMTPPEPQDLTDEQIRLIGQSHPSQISLNPEAALYKAAKEAYLGQAETSEWDEAGYRFQKWQRGVVACRIGDWQNVRVVKWGG